MGLRKRRAHGRGRPCFDTRKRWRHVHEVVHRFRKGIENASAGQQRAHDDGYPSERAHLRLIYPSQPHAAIPRERKSDRHTEGRQKQYLPEWAEVLDGKSKRAVHQGRHHVDVDQRGDHEQKDQAATDTENGPIQFGRSLRRSINRFFHGH